MAIEIKSRGGQVLYTAEHAQDVRQALNEAVVKGAYLRDADLGGAYLRGADLRDADLRGADLRGAKSLNKHLVEDLLMLFDQPGKIRAYKLVTAEGTGPTYKTITYAIGKTYAVADANTDETIQCAAGINLATMPWCLRE